MEWYHIISKSNRCFMPDNAIDGIVQVASADDIRPAKAPLMVKAGGGRERCAVGNGKLASGELMGFWRPEEGETLLLD